MATNFYFLGFIIFLCPAGLVQSFENCTCVLDHRGEYGPRYRALNCSYLQRTVILSSDYEFCGHLKDWIFRGNNLQTLQYQRIFAALRSLDVSENLLGFGSNENLFQNLFMVNELDISDNVIKSINFTGSNCYLNRLSASRNAISNLNPLRKCATLMFLRVDDNKIKSLPNNTFVPNPESSSQLQYIDLSHNPISSVEIRSFGVNDRLETLLLRHTRVLQSLPEGVFSGLKRLKTLSLAGNKIKNLPTRIFENLSNLEELELQSNILVNLPRGIFNNLVSLRNLILSDNKIEKISSDQFSRLHSLENLSLMKNKLKSLPSLDLCSGPIQTALFNMNEITDAPEAAVRALMRYGFMFGDLRQNPLPYEAIEWAENATDIQIDWHDRPCGRLSYSAKNHGSFIICTDPKPFYPTTVAQDIKEIYSV